MTGAAIICNWISYTLMIKKCWIQMMFYSKQQCFFSFICSRAWRHRADTESQVCKIFLMWRERLDNLISHTDWEKRGIMGEQRRRVGKSITCSTRPPGYQWTVLHTALCPKTFCCYWPQSAKDLIYSIFNTEVKHLNLRVSLLIFFSKSFI